MIWSLTEARRQLALAARRSNRIDARRHPGRHPLRCAMLVSAWCLIGAVAAPAQVADLPPRPPMDPALPYAFPPVVRRTLPNGLEVAVIERRDLPLVVVRTVFAGGPSHDPPDKEGVFAMARFLLNEGTAERPQERLAESFAAMGSVVTDNGFTTVTANLDSSLALLADMLMRPAFPQAAIDRARAGRLAIARAARTDGNAITTRVFTSVLFGPDHTFARFESEESLARITRDDIVASHRQWVRPDAMKLIVVGDVSPGEFFARVERVLGGWQRAEPPRGGASGDMWSQPPPPAPAYTLPPTAIYLVDVPGANSYIRSATLSAPRDSPDIPALDIVNAVFGALSGSRLHTELRERRGFAFFASSAFQWRAPPAPSVFYTTQSSVAPQTTDSVVAVILAELRAIAGERPPTEAEFGFARGNRTASLPLQLETHEALAIQLVELFQHRLPTDFVTRHYAGLLRTTREDVIRAARTHLDHRRTAIVVVGDAAVLEPALRDADLAPVLRVDHTGKPLR